MYMYPYMYVCVCVSRGVEIVNWAADAKKAREDERLLPARRRGRLPDTREELRRHNNSGRRTNLSKSPYAQTTKWQQVLTRLAKISKMSKLN